MNRFYLFLVLLLAFALSLNGCGNAEGDPTSNPMNSPTSGLTGQSAPSGSILWGYYDVNVDLDNQTVEAVADRTAMFASNIVIFLNSSPANLSFKFNSLTPGAGYVDVN